jgi:PadR family transcriptional regulator, regulatory protein PadR
VTSDPRLSHQTLRVLSVFLEEPKNEFAGSDIWKKTRLLSGTLYPILLRLESCGWLTSEWEKLDPSETGRPRKRLYRLTAIGNGKASNALLELRVLPNGRTEWSS